MEDSKGSTTTKEAADAKVREGKSGSSNVNEAGQLDKVMNEGKEAKASPTPDPKKDP
ncbi:MAG: hypothetical protein QOD42_152 [Sphingomonadales bacterium]|nr:hypothetical protein [Sphingomonadales bacterium]